MTVDKGFQILIAALIVTSVWWWLSGSRNPEQEQRSERQATETQSLLEEDEVQTRSLPKKVLPSPGFFKANPSSPFKSPRKKSAKSEPQFPPSNQVQFEVKEGNYAIGFGDLILGTLDEGAEVKTGLFEPSDRALWPSAVIPFAINDDVVQPHLIRQALSYMMQNTPLQFVALEEGDKDAIVFMRGEELCASQLGRVGGFQVILLASGCGVTEILHEVMHALGFVHEHSREDRDSFIEVLWDNIPEAFWPQFFKVPTQWVHGYTGSVFDFDPESIMMYRPDAFVSQPGLFSLRARAGRVLPSPSRFLSKQDLLRVSYLYGE